jgi:DNA-binding SARP family transcriptional activator
VAQRDGLILEANNRARELGIAPASLAAGARCCDVVCSAMRDQVEARVGCLTEAALKAGTPLPEVRVDVPGRDGEAAVWVTASTLSPASGVVVFHLRPGKPGDRRRRVEEGWGPDERYRARVHTLGPTRLEIGHGAVERDWLHRRPGQLLKYLIAERHRLVTSDEIAEALWPQSGPEGLGRVRQYVHALRQVVEPDRPRGAPSELIVSKPGGYGIDRTLVWIDADHFEREANAGLTLYLEGESELARPRLEEAVATYGGDFLAEDRYADWAFSERERLHELAGKALRALMSIELASRELDRAAGFAHRLADLEPLDLDVQRAYIDVCMRLGRRTEAARRYSLLQRRSRETFGQGPDFSLADIVAGQASAAAAPSTD